MWGVVERGMNQPFPNVTDSLKVVIILVMFNIIKNCVMGSHEFNFGPLYVCIYLENDLCIFRIMLGKLYRVLLLIAKNW